eukprot:Sspe_Gene.12175::Locus_4142_Transcript_1_1_Confidence_1.000_Length_954::g.12175::m.12175
MSFKNGVDTTYRNKARVRGGAGEFSWKQLEGDSKAALGEYYLGRSQMCEDLWYSRKNDKAGKRVREDEISKIKEQEQDLMREMLGLKPIKRRHRELTSREEEELLKREKFDKFADNQALGLGLNLRSRKATAQFMEVTGQVPEDLSKQETYTSITAGSLQGNVDPAELAKRSKAPEQTTTSEPAGPVDPELARMERKVREKEEKRRLKKLKKEKKKEKKRAKKQRKKEKKRARKEKKDSSTKRHDSSSDDSDSSSSSSSSS